MPDSEAAGDCTDVVRGRRFLAVSVFLGETPLRVDHCLDTRRPHMGGGYTILPTTFLCNAGGCRYRSLAKQRVSADVMEIGCKACRRCDPHTPGSWEWPVDVRAEE